MTDRATRVVDRLQARIEQIEAQLADCQRQLETVRASEATFRAIVEHANDSVATLSYAGEITYLSPNVQRTIGYGPAEVVGRSFASFIHPDDLPHMSRIVAQVMATAQPYVGLEYRVLHKQGHYVWHCANLSVYQNEAGQPVLIAIGRDATQQKATEAALAKSQAQFEAILQNANVAIFAKDLEGRYIFANRWVAAEVGIPIVEILGKTDADLLPAEVAHMLQANDRLALETGSPLRLEEVIATPEGDRAYLAIKFPLQDPAGNPYAICGISTNITDLKRTEAALRESESRLNRILDRTLGCIGDYRVYSDRRFIADYFSSGSFQLWGFTPEELLADLQIYMSRYEPADLQVIVEESFDYILSERPYKYEYRYHHPDGSLRWIELNLNSYRDEAENCWRTTVISLDITDRKRAEAALRESEAQLNRILDSTSALIANYRVYADRRFEPDYFSYASLKLWGFSAEAVLANPKLYQERIDPKDFQVFLDEEFDYIFSERPYSYTYRYHHPNGSLRWIQFDLTSYWDEAENCWRCTTISMDVSDRKLAEAALRESEAKLNRTLDRANACIADFRVYPDRRFIGTYFSSGSVQLWGLTPEEMLADLQPWLDRYHSEDLATSLAECFDYIFNERPYTYEYRYYHPDGSLRWIQLNVTSYWNETEGCWRTPTVSIDITDRKRLEEELRQSEARFRAIVENATDLIGTVNADGIFTYLSPNATDTVGYEARDLIGTAFALLIHPEDLPLCYEAFQQGLTSGRAMIPDYRMVHRDGSTRYFTTTVSGFEDENGNPVVLGMTRDITDRKRLEEDLRQSQQFLNSVIENIPLGFFAKDIRNDFRYVLINKCAEKFVCFSREEGIGHHDYELLPPAQADFYHQQDQLVVQRRSLVEIPEVEILTPDDERIFARILKLPLFDDRGNLTHLLCLTDDITELKQREAELRLARDDAEAANRAKSTFLANMSHELRTPLNVILGFTQLIDRENALSDRQRNFLNTINRSGEHLLNLINDVLEMSKIEAGRITLNPEPFDLRHLLNTLQEMFRVRAEAKHLSLTFHLPPDLPGAIVADEGKLRQVLINLLSNAVKFTEQGSITLEVALKMAERESGGGGEQGADSEISSIHPSTLSPTLYFTLTDTGTGIAPEEVEQLFQPFVQTASGLRVKEGTGLGLTISRQFVQLMGGEIQLQSVLGQGSTFTVQIPVMLTQAVLLRQTPRQQRVLGLAPGQPTYRLLIVDDRIDNCNLLTHLLRSIGFETQIACNGQEAIDCWQSWQPHLIWMDMRMPVMDGYEATRRIRALEAQHPLPTKIIALTASAFEEQRTLILAAGCDDFVRKPFREQMIFDKLTEHLGVQFVYADRPTDDPSPIADDAQSLVSISVMSPEWIRELRQAAIEIDDDRLMQLVAEIPPQHSQLAEQIRSLVNRFCFDEILELIAGGTDESISCP